VVPLRRLLGVAALLTLASACAHGPRSQERPPDSAPLAEGVGSYYGESLRGHRTASGERFDPDAFTAAHPGLAFGTCLRVENADNGRSVRVRVNDRGPFVQGRIIDLSAAAARALDFLRTGLARLRLYSC
jgi:peptidoglycan lytic transglycosylase